MQSLSALSLSSFELPSQRAAPIVWSAPGKGRSRDTAVVALQEPDYIDAISVEVLPVANDPAMSGRTRMQAALELYTSISRNHVRPPVSLHLIA